MYFKVHCPLYFKSVCAATTEKIDKPHSVLVTCNNSMKLYTCIQSSPGLAGSPNENMQDICLFLLLCHWQGTRDQNMFRFMLYDLVLLALTIFNVLQDLWNQTVKLAPLAITFLTTTPLVKRLDQNALVILILHPKKYHIKV